MEPEGGIVAVEALSADTTFVFAVRDLESGEPREAILLRADDGVNGWLNSCRHLTHVELDKGSGALVRDGEIVCTNHDAYFEADSGRCTYGPCEGAVLESVEVVVDDGAVYLDDDGYEFCHAGPLPTDPTDLSSTANVEL